MYHIYYECTFSIIMYVTYHSYLLVGLNNFYVHNVITFNEIDCPIVKRSTGILMSVYLLI